MRKYCFCIVLTFLLTASSGCATLFQKDKELKEYQRDEEQYKPYKLKNTIEGYKEFISLYPKNLFVGEAKLKIENLEFAPYEKADSIEGYMEFKMRYPDNRHTYKASVKIEQAEIKRYEKMDTIEGYKEFLAKYPDSTFAVLAKSRLQELEFRENANTLLKEYGFDLLGYRLYFKRLKKTLKPVDGFNPGNFIFFTSLITNKDKHYFHTSLMYPTSLSHLDPDSAGVQEMFFNPVLSKALIHLEKKFMKKSKIDGFSFDIASSEHSYYGDRKIILEYYFLLSPVNLFANDKLDTKSLLAQSIVVSPDKEVVTVKRISPAKAPASSISQPIKDLDGLKIMTMVSEREKSKDYIISRTWKRGRHAMKTIEKRKNLRGKDGFISKSVLRYLDPPDYYGTNILTWNYQDREPAYWGMAPRGELSTAPRLTDTERTRPPAEADFSLVDYVNIKVEKERHELLRSEDLKGKECFVVESTPILKDIKYGKKISWIDQIDFIPLQVEYWNREGTLWKKLNIEWQDKFGFWFWESAVLENLQTGEKTLITTNDVRVNVGLDDRDFTRQGLEKQRHGF
jgi:hypothetical protein